MKVKMSLIRGQNLAEKVLAALAPGCTRIEIAGSVKRCEPEVGDLEFVCIPRSKQQGMFDNLDLSATHLNDILNELTRLNRLRSGHANGDKYKSFIVSSAEVQLDLFIVTPPEWGVCSTIRTGPVEFSRRLVTQRALSNGWGYLPGDEVSGYWYVDDNRLHQNGQRRLVWVRPKDKEPYEKTEWYGGTPLDTPEESDVFRLLGLAWIEPQNRR